MLKSGQCQPYCNLYLFKCFVHIYVDNCLFVFRFVCVCDKNHMVISRCNEMTIIWPSTINLQKVKSSTRSHILQYHIWCILRSINKGTRESTWFQLSTRSTKFNRCFESEHSHQMEEGVKHSHNNKMCE